MDHPDWSVTNMDDKPLNIDNAFDKILFELESIGSLQYGDKLSITSEFVSSEKKSYGNSVIRTIIGETRNRDFACILHTINAALEFSTLILESKYLCAYDDIKKVITKVDIENYDVRIKKITRIYEALRSSCKGINNFKKSYNDDGNIEKKVDHLIQRIKEYTEQLRKNMVELSRLKLLYINAHPSASSFISTLVTHDCECGEASISTSPDNAY
jgi:hypothetical protein